ncbi:CCA tRNA nucleotidyltransferase [Leuconostoc palmae]|uniref:CCA tRNA nucleotidyltransferase n=1 Tax=Leuconostoc palmae TaxID=501487 RepID=UPI001C7D3DDD|nr:CCA tRNA nucleotidyltransferase [Leuconostoc palmae]
MEFKSLPKEFLEAKPILEKIDHAGFEAFFVGGSVRDMLLGNPIHDVDIATSAFPEEVKTIFDRTVDTGIQHGTVMVLDHGQGYEITTFRTESTYTDFRRPDRVTFVRTLKEDLKRRDFTINAMAMTKDAKIIDLFDGLLDMKVHSLRAVGNAETRFNEDALRIMRALRFSSQLGFSIEEETKFALQKLASNLEKIAVERIRVEFEKLLMGAYAPKSLELAEKLDILKYLPGNLMSMNLPEFRKALELTHPESTQEVWLLIGYYLNLEKEDLEKFMRSWKTSRADIQAVTSVVPVAKNIINATTYQLYEINQYEELLLSLLNMIQTSPEVINKIYTIFRKMPIKKIQDLSINGSMLIEQAIVAPGPDMGRILKIIEQQVVDEKVPNKQEILLKYAKELVKNEKN